MTREESAANLIAGATKSSSEYITVVREHLLLALGVTKPAEAPDGGKPADNAPSDDVH